MSELSENSKIPAIRFEGFGRAWEEVSLDNFGTATSGTSIESEFSDNDKYKVISIGSYSEKSEYTDQGIRAGFSEKTKIRILNKNDLTMILNDKTLAGNIIGRVLLINEDDSFIYNQRTQRIEPYLTKHEPQFLYQLLNAPLMRLKIIKSSQGNTQIYVNWSSIKKIIYLLPNKKEQTQIGNFFQQIDRLIAQHQQKHDKLLSVKKALLEKMFPKQGETQPAIRFKGFSEAWEEKALGEVVTLINGRAYSQDELLSQGRFKVLRVGNFYTNTSWYYSDMELGDKYYANSGDLLYTWSASFGPHIWQGGKVIYHYHIWKLLLSEELDKMFALHTLDYDKEKLLSDKNGSTMVHITKEGMEKKSISIPSKKEQTKIGNLFQQLDSLINQQQSQLTKLGNIKQAMLAKMFV